MAHLQSPRWKGNINRVGIEDLEIPIQVHDGNQVLHLLSMVNAMVSLDKTEHRGIHMSRIYFALHDHLKDTVLNLPTVKKLLHLLIESQAGISQRAYLKIQWKWPVQRTTLKSQLKGWRCYPVFYEGTLSHQGEGETVMGLELTYSSTCPCSAHLSREIIQKKFREKMASHAMSTDAIHDWLGKEHSMAATPHAQKSRAIVRLTVEEEQQSLLELIDEIENSLGTPVQTAVKREDEQEFAQMNSRNLMFVEDAARCIAHALQKKPWIKDYQVYVKHFESLHPFDVACYVDKNYMQKKNM